MDYQQQRSTHSEEREKSVGPVSGASSGMRYKTNTLPLNLDNRERCVSVPSGHYAATPNSATTPRKNMMRGKSPATSSISGNRGGPGFQHYGSSLSLSNGRADDIAATADLTTRTLRPPSPTTLKKSSIPGKPKLNPEKVISTPSSGVQRPSLPSLNSVELKSPKLADYLEKPRMVSCPSNRLQTRLAASEAHAKRIHAGQQQEEYRNLRLGNFLESGESNEEELIPERLRLYYKDTYFSEWNPNSPISKGVV